LERVRELAAAHTVVADAIARRERPPPVRMPIDIERLDPQSSELAADPPVGDRWAERGLVDILRTRALIAEITISLIRLRDLVAESPGSSPEPERASAIAAMTS
jgi:hypothetical protein